MPGRLEKSWAGLEKAVQCIEENFMPPLQTLVRAASQSPTPVFDGVALSPRERTVACAIALIRGWTDLFEACLPGMTPDTVVTPPEAGDRCKEAWARIRHPDGASRPFGEFQFSDQLVHMTGGNLLCVALMLGRWTMAGQLLDHGFLPHPENPPGGWRPLAILARMDGKLQSYPIPGSVEDMALRALVARIGQESPLDFQREAVDMATLCINPIVLDVLGKFPGVLDPNDGERASLFNLEMACRTGSWYQQSMFAGEKNEPCGPALLQTRVSGMLRTLLVAGHEVDEEGQAVLEKAQLWTGLTENLTEAREQWRLQMLLDSPVLAAPPKPPRL